MNFANFMDKVDRMTDGNQVNRIIVNISFMLANRDLAQLRDVKRQIREFIGETPVEIPREEFNKMLWTLYLVIDAHESSITPGLKTKRYVASIRGNKKIQDFILWLHEERANYVNKRPEINEDDLEELYNYHLIQHTNQPKEWHQALLRLTNDGRRIAKRLKYERELVEAYKTTP